MQSFPFSTDEIHDLLLHYPDAWEFGVIPVLATHLAKARGTVVTISVIMDEEENLELRKLLDIIHGARAPKPVVSVMDESLQTVEA